MSTWLQLLPLELDGINNDKMIEPMHPLEKADHVVGEMSDMSKRLFTLAQLLDKSGNQSKLDAQYCTDKVERLEHMAQTNEFLAKSETVRTLMWIGIKDEFGLWNEGIGVRVGFKVVTQPERSEDDIPPFLRRLLHLD